MAKEYYIVYNGNAVGPMPLNDLFSYGLNPHSQVWCQGMQQWAEAYTVPEVMGAINASRGGFSDPEAVAPPPAPDPIQINPGAPPQNHQNQWQQPTQNRWNQPYSHNSYPADKQNIVFGLLAIFLGGFGVQYFYVGKTMGGIICILLSFCTCGLWSIINFIQGICVICMSQQEFERKFVYTNSTFPIL